MKNKVNGMHPGLEKMYRKADVFISIVIVVYLLVSFCFAFVHQTWVETIVFNLTILFIYLILFILFRNNAIFRIGISMIVFSYPNFFIYQMHGYPLIHVLYASSALTVIVYQNFRYTVFSFIPGLSYYFFAFYMKAQGRDVSSFFLAGSSDTTTMIVIGSFVPLFTIIIVYFLIRNLRQITLKNFEYIRNIKIQNQQMEQNKEFAYQIAQGNLDITYDKKEDDQLKQALILMQQSLREAHEKDIQEKFQDRGMAQISHLLRQYNDDIQLLAQKLISEIVKYVGANQGGFFILMQEGHTDPYLELTACYAFDKEKYQQKKIFLGEGLLGQTMLEKKTVHLKDIPENYIQISSGLGEGIPKSILILPLFTEDSVEGIIELASFHVLEEYKVDLLNKLAESIATTLQTTRANLRTRRLLMETQEQTEKMRAQEEEMTQNMEELQTTQEAMEQKQHELEAMNNKIGANSRVLAKALEKNREKEKKSKNVIRELEEKVKVLEGEKKMMQEQVKNEAKI